MIIVGGGSALLVLLMMLLVLVVFFVLVPLTLVRGSRRTVHRLGAGWEPQHAPAPPPVPGAGWQPPQTPVLPPVVAADVASLRDRLGHDVRTLEPGEDPVSRQALADAAERYATASTLLERARSDAQLRTAWLAAVEGLAASRTVRARLGLDLGPPVPALPGAGPQLTSRARIDVAGRTAVGAPTYEPGRPHWFPGGYYGGRHVPGGWYDVPFWPSALLLGGLGGLGMGGLAMGGLSGAMFGDDVGYGEDLGFGGFGGFGGGGGWDGGGWDGGGDWGGGGGGGGWDGGGGDW